MVSGLNVPLAGPVLDGKFGQNGLGRYQVALCFGGITLRYFVDLWQYLRQTIPPGPIGQLLPTPKKAKKYHLKRRQCLQVGNCKQLPTPVTHPERVFLILSPHLPLTTLTAHNHLELSFCGCTRFHRSRVEYLFQRSIDSVKIVW